MLRSWLRFLTVLVIGAVAVFATPPLTEIQDIIYKADGTLFDGVAQVEWKNFVAADGSPVGANTVSFRIVRGQLHVSLVPTTNAQQPVNYTVRYNTEGRTQVIETWSVPPSKATLRLSDVRVTGGSAGNLTSSLSITDVTGLRTELDLRPTRGTTWTPGRTAVIGQSGAVESAFGSPGDCVHVDGTSGPCGSASGSGSGNATITYVDGEVPSGTIDGVNRALKLAVAPNPAQSLRLFLNGLLLATGSDYSITGTDILMFRAPSVGSIVQASYRTSGAVATIVDAETPAGVINGLNAAFTLQNTPSPSNSVQLYRNGMLQRLGVDYTISGATITFTSVSIPRSGDALIVSYRK